MGGVLEALLRRLALCIEKLRQIILHFRHTQPTQVELGGLTATPWLLLSSLCLRPQCPFGDLLPL